MKSDYIGKITSAGTQKVEAPVKASPKKGKSATKKGSDLRGGK